NDDEYEYATFSEEEQEEEEEDNETSLRSSRQNSVVFDEEIVHGLLEFFKEKEEESGIEVNTPAITTRARSACTSFRYVGDEPSLRVTKKIAFVLDDDKMEELSLLSILGYYKFVLGLQPRPIINIREIYSKLSSRNKKTSYVYKNSYHELEEAYVAQICLTWEALNWNYNYFQQLRASRRESVPGWPCLYCTAVSTSSCITTLHRERSIIKMVGDHRFARMRSNRSNSDDVKKDEYLGSRISSESFLGTFRWDLLLIVEILRLFIYLPSSSMESYSPLLQAFATSSSLTTRGKMFSSSRRCDCYRSDTVNNSRGGRVGAALQDMGTGQDLLVKIGAPVPLVFLDQY
ncbi:ribosomal protein L34Ae protein, partial [Tanacetum coccineum]